MTLKQGSITIFLQYLPFIIVGMAASLTHYTVALWSYYWWGNIAAINSNWLGFLAAFPVSYLGHRFWTFQATTMKHPQAILKFFVVALLSFLGNQGLLWLGLQTTPLPFWLLLAIVMLLIALLTYALSKYWVFTKKI